MKVARPPSPSVAYSDFLQCMLLANAQVQLQARYHHRGEAASEKCLPAATFVRPRAYTARTAVPANQFHPDEACLTITARISRISTPVILNSSAMISEGRFE